ncbi:hypothetical protein BDZ88DRAFT_116880 [Geranomyces variabilis]|nr:hypothetical protein BDZ88DRAFT_116880 [Geranomyces variabilis]
MRSDLASTLRTRTGTRMRYVAGGRFFKSVHRLPANTVPVNANELAHVFRYYSPPASSNHEDDLPANDELETEAALDAGGLGFTLICTAMVRCWEPLLNRNYQTWAAGCSQRTKWHGQGRGEDSGHLIDGHDEMTNLIIGTSGGTLPLPTFQQAIGDMLGATLHNSASFCYTRDGIAHTITAGRHVCLNFGTADNPQVEARRQHSAARNREKTSQNPCERGPCL